MMNGEIWVESEPEKGSKFAFTVKMLIKGHKPISFENKTLLLVEDIEINREIMAAMLEDTRIQIECAANGQEAIDLFTSSPSKYDIITMDISMPVMDGVEATRRIRARTPEGARVPIIAITANVLPNEVKTYFDVGINDYISKPVDFDKLLHVLDKYLK
jgi:CheY-like chemotaxis protein